MDDPRIGTALRVCLLSGMRAGEAVGLVRDNLIWKGNLGWFAWIRPNEVRTLKTDAAERIVPLHSSLTPLLATLPATGRLFPGLSVNMVTKCFSVLREQVGINRQGVVFHSSRKWFEPSAALGYDPEHLTILSRAMASWFVRLDNSFFDVDDLGYKRSRVDIEQTAVLRFREEFPAIPLTSALMTAVLKRTIHTRHNVVDETILPWNGRVVCLPGDERRLVVARGVATINVWKLPSYRRLGVTEADFDVAGEFFDWFFTRAPEKDMFLNWLAWSLQNEGDKPNWAPFFYSAKMGTGKSAMGRLLIRLFGEQNAVTQNNIDKLTGRFNMTLLRSKLVICEEVNLKPGSGDANTLKTYITEKFTAGEAKGKETERVEQRVCLVLTSNHLPFWIEPEDRRYYIVNVDHDGYSRGPRAAEFAELIDRLDDWAADPANIAKLYNALLARVLPEGFSAKTLNVDVHGTEIMHTVFSSGRATILDQLQELLDSKGQHALAESDVVVLVVDKLKGNINSTKHLMSDLGWRKCSLKWGSVDHARQLWVRPGCAAERGTIYGPDGWSEKLATHLKDEIEIIK